MKLVVDAYGSTRCFVQQEQTPAARRVFAGNYALSAPDFLLVEVSNVFWKFCRRGEFEPAGAEVAMEELARHGIGFVPTISLLGRAREIARALDHAVYDCLYLAAAETVQAPVVTADRRLYDRASTGGWREQVLWIEDLPAPP